LVQAVEHGFFCTDCDFCVLCTELPAGLLHTDSDDDADAAVKGADGAAAAGPRGADVNEADSSSEEEEDSDDEGEEEEDEEVGAESTGGKADDMDAKTEQEVADAAMGQHAVAAVTEPDVGAVVNLYVPVAQRVSLQVD
jgi:flagellar motor protein MotB